MAFPEQDPRPFNRLEVEALKPDQSGVYGLLNLEKRVLWIYIGQGDIRQCLLAHLDGDNACIRAGKPTHFLYEVTSNTHGKEIELIVELDPICNKHRG